MKYLALIAIAASTTQAALGDDCYYDASICADDGLDCAEWEDSQYGPMASCEDCSNGNQFITDSYGDPVEYQCPARPDEGGDDDAVEEGGDDGGNPTPGPAPAPGPAGGEDSATKITFAAAAFAAATALYA